MGIGNGSSAQGCGKTFDLVAAAEALDARIRRIFFGLTREARYIKTKTRSGSTYNNIRAGHLHFSVTYITHHNTHTNKLELVGMLLKRFSHKRLIFIIIGVTY